MTCENVNIQVVLVGRLLDLSSPFSTLNASFLASEIFPNAHF